MEQDQFGQNINITYTITIDITALINKCRAITAILNGILWNRQREKQNKLEKYNSIVKSTATYGVEIWKFNKHLQSRFMSRKWSL